ncbi:MAG: hypothetical protein DRN30_00550 [Thermoplasmata archaeon]|nr:MAG: hypothetical protein DRN30_00550 [Thermoplasmata archaeon]
MSTKTKETIPLWLAIAITVLFSLPFGTLLGKYNLALWASFIAWAEYFALGAKPEALKYIWILFPLGAFWMAMFATFVALVPIGGTLTTVAVWIFVWVAVAAFVMRFHPMFQKGSLPYFNGLSMYLALYFGLYANGANIGAGQGPIVGNPVVDAWILFVWASLAGIFGGFLGWFNIAITFPRPVKE